MTTTASPDAAALQEAKSPRRSETRAFLVSSAGFALVLALFFLPALTSTRQFQYRDTGRLHEPTKHYLASELLHGHYPQWNPYDGLGQPLAGEALHALHHPFNLLLVALPFEAGFKAWVLCSFLMAAAGAFYWSRKLGLSRAAGMVAGLALALSGFLVSSIENLHILTSFAAVPWVLGATHAWLEKGGPRQLALLALASALCAAGGDPQIWGIAMVALPVYGALRDRDRRARGLGRGLVAMAAALVGAAPFILPVALWVSESSRNAGLVAIDEYRWNLSPFRLFELAVPGLFAGERGAQVHEAYAAICDDHATDLVPFAESIYLGASIAALAVVAASRNARERWLLAVAAVFLWAALGPRAGFSQIAHALPVISRFRYWEKLVAWPTLCLAMASGAGVDRLLSADAQRGLPRRALAIAAASAAALAAIAYLVSGHVEAWLSLAPERLPAARELAANAVLGLAQCAVVLTALALAAVLLARRHRLAPLLLVAIPVLDLAGANARAYVLFEPWLGHPTNAPLVDFLRAQDGLQRIAATDFTDLPANPQLSYFESFAYVGGRMLLPSWNVAAQVGNLEAYSPLPPDRLQRLQRSIANRTCPSPWQRLRWCSESRGAPVVGLWDVGYMIATVSPPPPPYEIVASDDLLRAYLVRVPHRPRVYLAGELSSVDRTGAGRFIDGAEIESSNSVVEGEIPQGYRPPTGEARLLVDEPERVQIEARADGAALVILNDALAKGWTASVDGRAAPILAANYLVRGVWMGPGTHTLAFVYRTPGLREGWAIAAAGALALLTWALWRRRAA
jgi:hypothetical protein